MENLLHGLLLFVVLVPSLIVHEMAHALSAWLLGDNTAKDEGRLHPDPRRHLDPLGTLMLLWMVFQGVGVGWAKPVPINPLRLRWRRAGVALVALAGPVSNLLLAALSAVLLVHLSPLWRSDWPERLLFVSAAVNVSLALFNLLPVYPLDGQKVFSGFLPGFLGRRLDFYAVRFGMWPLVILLLWEWVLPIPGPFGWLMGPAADWVLRALLLVP